MRKIIAAILSAAAAWLLLLAMLLSGVFFCTTSTSFYKHEYEKYDNAATIGISDEGLMEVTEGLLDYLWGKRDNLDMQAEIGGEMREVFTQREKDHMVDVRYLIELARNALVITLLGGIAAWVAAVLIVRKEKGGLRFSGIGYLAGAALLFAVVGIVVLLAMRDFTAVFVKFHEIFFTNDLWLLDWDDMLILMVPEPFFVDCAVIIAIIFGVGFAITAAIALLMILKKTPVKVEQEPAEAIEEIGGSDGDSFYKINEENQEDSEHIDAEEIFARLGLEEMGDDEEEELLISPVPATVQPVSAEFPVTAPDGSELNVRFEMKLDLKVEKGVDGRMILTMNPEHKPQVSLSSVPGQLAFTIYEEPSTLPTIPLQTPKISHTPVEGPVPTPDELLRQMDELMKGFPKDGEEGDA